MAIIVFKVDFIDTTNIRTMRNLIYSIICNMGPEHFKIYSPNNYK
jgi:hypothetical protein